MQTRTRPRLAALFALSLAAASTAPLFAQAGAGWTPPAADADPAELVDMGQLRAGQTIRQITAIFDADEKPTMRLPVRSLDPLPGGAGVTVQIKWTVRDHPHSAETVFEKTTDLTVAGGKEAMVSQELPLEAPGPYWVHVAMVADGKTLKKDMLGILYAPDRYKGEFTRPDDFKKFWDAKLEAMRKIPFDPKITENRAYAIDGYKGYDLQITGHDGERMDCVLILPTGKGPHDATLGGHREDPAKVRAVLKKAEGQPAGVGMWAQGDRRIRVGAASPEQSTYTRWNGRDDNNMLHVYLQNVRLMDYLRSRDDVKHIWLFGASRSGPSALAAAALAPEQVAAVNVHVPTSCGVSWNERPYRGWGRPPAYNDKGLKTAAYFDPVNFAPDLKVPVIMDGGFYDGLSPIPGMLAFCNRATNAPFVAWSIEQGHHGYFKKGGRDDMEKALAEHLAKQGIDPTASED